MTWGAWTSNDRLRAGLDVSMSPSSVGSGTASVTINWTLSGQTRYASYESGSGITDWSISGTHSQSGSMNGWNEGAMGTWVVASGSFSVNTSYSSAITVTVNAGYISGGAYPGTHPTVSVSITVPKRPYANPASPSGVSATRNDDTQATINWTREATSSAPVTSITVQRRTLTGDTWSGWSTDTTISGSWTSDAAMSYVKTGLSANHKYQWQIRQNNTSGSSAYVATGEVYMTPAEPVWPVSASKDPSGTSITVSWTPQAYTSGTITHQIERSVNGGAYGSVVTGIAQGTNTWQDNAPGAGSNAYRVAAKTSTGNLVSAYTLSNTVSTVVAPLAPTLLSPDGVALDLWNDGVTLTWQHNHGGDAAAQTHYRIRYSTNGGANWTTLADDIASSTSSRVVAAGTLANGFTYLWQVQTEGIVSGGYGPYSTSATITASARPVVTLRANHPPAAVSSLPLETQWDYAQDQNSPQAEWEAQLLADDGTTVLETLTGSGTTDNATYAYPLADATSYVVRVRAKSGAGLWGDYTSRAIDFNLLPPAASHVAATYSECTGVMVLSITADAPVGGVTVAVATVTIDRRVAGGDWVTIATGIPVPNTILDVTPLTNGVNEYRLTSVSASPSYAVMSPVSATATDGGSGSGLWAFLSYGDGFANVLRLHGDLKVGDGVDRVRAAPGFLGRPKPGLLVGENTSWKVSVAGVAYYDERCAVVDPDECTHDSPPVDWRTAAKEAEIVCYRDYTGRRLFGMLGALDVQDLTWPYTASVTFSVTETDFAEVAGTVTI